MTTATEPQDIVTAQRSLTLTEKLVGAALDVENVQKAGENKAQNYTYVRAEDVVAAATKALLARGVLTEFECVDADVQPITSKGGTAGLIVTATCRLIVTDSESGDWITLKAMGSGSDYPGDKAIYKAMTGARKYAFIHLLAIPIGDDPDAHRAEGDARRTSNKAPSLPPETVESIRDGFKALGLSWGRIELLMGSVGAEPKVRRADSLLKAIREMEPAQAVELEKLIQVEGDRGGNSGGNSGQ